VTEDPQRIDLRPSWRVFVSGVVSTILLLVTSIAAGRIAVIATVLLLLGLIIGAFTVFDTPYRTILDSTGVRRCCLGRKHHTQWEHVDIIDRSLALTQARNRDDSGNSSGRRPGGLSVGVRRRKYMLTDVAEADAQYNALAAAVAVWCPDVIFRASPPSRTTDTRRDRP
jgi:hypothetical protein